MGVWLGPRGLPKYKRPPLFTFTDNNGNPLNYEYRERVASDGTVNWEAVFKITGNLLFTRIVPEIEVFMVGPGENGISGSASGSTAVGGRGGNGGEVKNARVAVNAGIVYPLRVEAPGGVTSGFGVTAAGGAGKPGGAGARAADNNRTNAGNGTPGTLSFNGTATDGSDGRLYWYAVRFGASGGGGGARSPNYTIAAAGYEASSNSGDGGLYNAAGKPADLVGSGAGGGGGGSDLGGGQQWNYSAGGAGASGIIIIRNAR